MHHPLEIWDGRPYAILGSRLRRGPPQHFAAPLQIRPYTRFFTPLPAHFAAVPLLVGLPTLLPGNDAAVEGSRLTL